MSQYNAQLNKSASQRFVQCIHFSWVQSPSICFSACCCFPHFLSCCHSPSLSRPRMGEAGEALCLGHLGSAALQKMLEFCYNRRRLYLSVTTCQVGCGESSKANVIVLGELSVADDSRTLTKAHLYVILRAQSPPEI